MTNRTPSAAVGIAGLLLSSCLPIHYTLELDAHRGPAPRRVPREWMLCPDDARDACDGAFHRVAARDFDGALAQLLSVAPSVSTYRANRAKDNTTGPIFYNIAIVRLIQRDYASAWTYAQAAGLLAGTAEVRAKLPELLREINAERTWFATGSEKLAAAVYAGPSADPYSVDAAVRHCPSTSHVDAERLRQLRAQKQLGKLAEACVPGAAAGPAPGPCLFGAEDCAERCSAGSARSCGVLNELGTLNSLSERACAGADQETCAYLAISMVTGSLLGDPMATLRKACDAKQPFACEWLARGP